jgi:hypothetical protein
MRPPTLRMSSWRIADREPVATFGQTCQGEVVAEQKIKMTLPDGRVVDGVRIGLQESTERWSEFVFEDGTKVKAKVTIIEAQRALGEYDPTGSPWLSISVQPVVSPPEIPESLKKHGKKDKK